MMVMSCDTSTTSSQPETSPLPSNTITPELAEQSPSENLTVLDQNPPAVAATQTISAKGIGPAKLGMTLGQLKQVLGSNAEFKVVSPFMVDLDAIAVIKAKTVQYYILYPVRTIFADSSLIEVLLTDNPNFRTVAGVGPGTLLTQAEAIYGDATLSYNTQNESREQVRFANQPAQNVTFQPIAPAQQFAGIYPSQSGEYNETTKFYESASIRSVLVQGS